MPEYHPDSADVKFVLKEVLAVGRLNLPGFERIDNDLVSALVDHVASFAAKELGPLNSTGDKIGARLDGEQVLTAPGFVDAYRSYAAAGWPAMTCSEADGGDGIPGVIFTVVEEMVAGANQAFAMAPMTSRGAYQVISRHATEELKARYLPKVVTGEWTTAMSLTEPQCGSALGLVRTRAHLAADGSYRITGTKIFNSWGDHDLTDNIVHLVLARVDGAPDGIKGLSLFLVPKYVVGKNEVLEGRNSWSVSSLEDKLGIHASPTCVTNFDGATGFLIGELNRGMANMFIMMNSMRLATGIGAIGLAAAAYRNALNYSRQRLAGRSVSGSKYPELPADPIIVHPDVRRMLMTMKAIIEGGRAFGFWVSLHLDVSERHPDDVERESSGALVALLTPVVKAFLSDKAFECADMAMQCFGGHGYVRDNGAEQYVRDVRVLRLGEGTSGIQAMDFLGRKVLGDKGDALGDYFTRIDRALAQADDDSLASIVGPVRDSLDTIRKLTDEHLPVWERDPQDMAAVSLDYLHLIGYLSLGFMWVRMATTVNELSKESADSLLLDNKLRSARFYCAYVLPEIAALVLRVRAGSAATMSIPEHEF